MLDEVLAQSGDVRGTLARAAVMRADAQVGAQMKRIAAEYAGRAYARALVLRGSTAVLLGLAARLMARAGDALRAPAAGPKLLARFEALIDAHYVEHWGVADYARALAITPTHLSRLARQATGLPASRLIDDRVVREARRQLVYTNLQVATIAYALGYDDPAHFSRVFARATGMSPRRFRDRLAGREPR
jgi:AraC family transcriptional activator of pobA